MSRTALALALFALVGCSEQLKPASIETPRGTVTYKERTGDGRGTIDAALREPTAAELELIRSARRKAAAFIDRYVPARKPGADLLDDLDLAFAAWLHSTDVRKESPMEVERIVGASLGEYCIERLPVRWAVATDERGPEFVLAGENPVSRSYPFASVRYRIEDRKTDFIGPLYETLVEFRRKAS